MNDALNIACELVAGTAKAERSNEYPLRSYSSAEKYRCEHEQEAEDISRHHTRGALTAAAAVTKGCTTRATTNAEKK